MLTATINGNKSQFQDGISILDACRSLGLDIPTLCNDPRLKPIGSCRMCLVEIQGRPHPLTSCNSLLTDGMVISTHTPLLERERTMLLRMLAQDHPADEFRLFPDKDFHLLDEEKVRVQSRYGEGSLPIRITGAVKPGELFATFHAAEVFLNRVTSSYRDRYVKSPEYKITAVKIEKY